jgi:hypothetical protein
VFLETIFPPKSLFRRWKESYRSYRIIRETEHYQHICRHQLILGISEVSRLVLPRLLDCFNTDPVGRVITSGMFQTPLPAPSQHRPPVRLIYVVPYSISAISLPIRSYRLGQILGIIPCLNNRACLACLTRTQTPYTGTYPSRVVQVDEAKPGIRHHIDTSVPSTCVQDLDRAKCTTSGRKNANGGVSVEYVVAL